MATESLTEMGEDELVSRLAEGKERLFKLRFQLATGQLENSAALKAAKKDIARLLTELRAREIAAAEAVAGGAS
ncbi:MAG: 50S ribosomal protein L29 [Microthrixaceae bacterium]